jgi:hypothetical protein
MRIIIEFFHILKKHSLISNTYLPYLFSILCTGHIFLEQLIQS